MGLKQLSTFMYYHIIHLGTITQRDTNDRLNSQYLKRLVYFPAVIMPIRSGDYLVKYLKTKNLHNIKTL